MTIEEANKIISEFMGVKKIKLFAISDDEGKSSKACFDTEEEAVHFLYEDYKGRFSDCSIVDWSYYKRYSESLDALVPVWEKMGYSKTQGRLEWAVCFQSEI
jgi:hypothetical protein